MNRQTKKEIRRLAVKILVAVLALGLAFWGYAFVYRGKTEPPAKYPVTNQDAAVYSLRGQIQMLSQQEELNTFAFEGRKKEKEYGTYIIPGLRYTRTFLNVEGTKQAVCTSMTPQGLAVTDEYVLVSAYCHTEKHNSVIYVINKETHRFIKEVVLPGLPHVGGLAYDQEHDMLWYSSNTNGIAQAISIKMDYMGSADWMPRNLDRRVEIVFPVEDEKIKKELEHVLDLEFKDNVKAHILQPDGTYVKPDKRGKAQINSQMEFCIEATEKAALHKHEEKKSRVFIPAEPAEDIEE